MNAFAARWFSPIVAFGFTMGAAIDNHAWVAACFGFICGVLFFAKLTDPPAPNL